MWVESSQVTSGFYFEESSELEGGRKRGVHETCKQSWRGRRRTRTAQGEDTRREEPGSGYQSNSRGQLVCPQKDSCICNEGSVSLTTRFYVTEEGNEKRSRGEETMGSVTG